MKKMSKKVLSLILAVIMVFSMGISLPNTAAVTRAASKVYWNPYSNYIATYKPGDNIGAYSEVLSIMGCTKASEIKNLKSSNKAVCRAYPRDGYIRVEFGDKAGTSTISCTVKGVKLKKVFTVKKYSNPLSMMKIGTSNFTSKFAKTDTYNLNKAFKSKKLTLKAKNGWVIQSVYVQNGSKYNNYEVKKTSYSRTITLSSDSSYVSVLMKNKSNNLQESLTFRKSSF